MRTAPLVGTAAGTIEAKVRLQSVHSDRLLMASDLDNIQGVR
jgi:hypothetical protein